jgi:uncharacterized membrane protein
MDTAPAHTLALTMRACFRTCNAMPRLVSRSLSALLRIFITGALAALPLVATVLIIVWAVQLLHRWLGPGSTVGQWMTALGLTVGDSEVLGYVIGVAIVAAAIFALGLLVETGLQRGLASAFNALVHRIPVVRTVYELLRKATSLFANNGDDDKDGLRSMSPVWCHFGGPQAEGSSVALALLGSEEPVLVDGQACWAVMIPTSPVPVGGGLIYVPTHWVTKADVSIEAVTSIYVSMGLTSAEHLPKAAGVSVRRLTLPG